MFKTMKEITNIAECIPGYTAVYKIGQNVERIYYSHNMPELLGYTEEEYKSNNIDPLSLIFSQDIDGVIEKLTTAVKNKEKIDFSYRLLHKTKRTIWVRCHGNYIGEIEGNAIYLTSIYDVTDEWNSRDIILDSSDRGVVVFDRDTKIVLYGNQKFFDFANITREECLGSLCYNVVCKAGVFDEKQCICFKAIGQKEPLINYNPVTDRYFAISASEIMWGEHSALIFYLADITSDTKKDQEITEKNEKLRQVQEEAIRSYKKQLEMITDSNSDVLSICRLNLTKNICIPGTYGTDFMRSLQKHGTVDDYFRLAKEHMDEEDISRLENYSSSASLIEAFENGTKDLSQDAYFHIEKNKGIYVLITLHMSKNPITQDVEALIYTRDLTSVKLQKDIMRCLMEQQYESISIIDVNSSKVSVLSYNYDGIAGSKYEGEDYDVCMEYFVNTYVEEQERENYKKNADLKFIKQILDEAGHYEFLFHFKSGTEAISLKTIEYYYSDERHHTIIGATRDITEVTKQQRKSLNELKEALLRADKATEAKSAFFSNISHDMRTPLNGILGFSGLGKEALTLDEAKDYFTKIQSSGEFLLKLINDTLDISKIESGQMRLKIDKTNLDELLKETINSVEETAHEKQINFYVDCPNSNNRYVITDKLRLEQLLTNLLGNAIKFTSKGGKVSFIVRELETEEYECNYKISILDNGVGMKPDFVPHAFEAYSQDESTSTIKAMGTGLGLAIVKQIVMLMKGKITLESEEGKGTRFDIWLPLKAAQKDKSEETATYKNICLKGKKILLCEDHPINRELACRLLERKGMEIVCAENGKIGVEIFSHSEIGEYQAILMDIRMPEMNGLEAAETIRSLDRADAKNIPIIAMTANAYESDKNAAISFGMNAHLAKPIDPKKLYRTLDEYINIES